MPKQPHIGDALPAIRLMPFGQACGGRTKYCTPTATWPRGQSQQTMGLPGSDSGSHPNPACKPWLSSRAERNERLRLEVVHALGREVTDSLVDLLIATVHRIGVGAERR